MSTFRAARRSYFALPRAPRLILTLVLGLHLAAGIAALVRGEDGV